MERNEKKVGRWQNVDFAGKMVKGKTLEEAEKITEKDVINFLGGIPKPKIHCTCLVKRTLQKAIKYPGALNVIPITIRFKHGLEKRA